MPGPARERVELPQGPVHYRSIGSGPTIVFVHGVFVNGDLWRKVVDRLADRYRCIVPDWPLGSHTEPMHPDANLTTPGLARLVADFLTALDLRDVTLVANDTGGAISQFVVADHAERVGRLVLTSCDAFEVFPPKPFGFFSLLPRIPGAALVLGRVMQLGPSRRLPIAYGWLSHEMPPKEVLDSYTQPLLQPAIRRDALKVLAGMSNEQTLSVARRLPGFDRPVLLAWGGDDRLFPLDLAERLAATFPNSRLEVVAGARTFVPEDRPSELTALIDDFVVSNT
jgi:pimeloyl-ACP methyl ester carboxylesterase